MLIKGATHNLIVRTRSEVALYMLNHKRAHLRELEERFRVTLTVSADATVTGQQSYVIDRGEQVHSVEAAKHLAAAARAETPVEETVEPEDAEAAEEAAEAEYAAEEGEARDEGEREGGRRRRRRRGRGGRGRNGEQREAAPFTHDTVAEHAVAHEDHDAGAPEEFEGEQAEQQSDAEAGGQRDGRHRRRRGRRGGRRNRRGRGEAAPYGNGGEPAHEVHAGSDFPPVSEEDADAMAPPFDREPEQAAAAEAAPTAQTPPEEAAPEQAGGEPDALRRRSTVREPASFGSEAAPAPSPTLPPPTPVVTSSGEETATPRRGWWGRRLMGDKD